MRSIVDGVFYFIFFGFSAARARARFREVVLHGTKDVENEFRVSDVYLGVWGSSRFVAESDLAFFCLAGPVTTDRRRRLASTRAVARGEPKLEVCSLGPLRAVSEEPWCRHQNSRRPRVASPGLPLEETQNSCAHRPRRAPRRTAQVSNGSRSSL